MGKMTFDVPDDVEMMFRKKVLDRFGPRRGALSRALAEAMRLWVERDP